METEREKALSRFGIVAGIGLASIRCSRGGRLVRFHAEEATVVYTFSPQRLRGPYSKSFLFLDDHVSCRAAGLTLELY